MRRVSALAVAAGLVAACGLDESGILSPHDDAGIEASSPEAGGDVSIDVAMDVLGDVLGDVTQETTPAPCSEPPGACVAALPSNWDLVAFGDGTTACPTSYPTQDVVSDPVAQTGACDCSCTVNNHPSCEQGSLQRWISSDTSCASAGVTLTVNGPGCTPWPSGGPLSSHSKSTPLPPVGGTCTGNVLSDTSKVATTAAGRACVPPTQCQEQLCGGDVPTGFALCVVASGVQTCPPGWGSTPVVVGDGVADVGCSTCTCDVNGPSSCGSASVTIFGNGNCSTTLATMPVDSKCDSDPAAGQQPYAFEYSATLTEVCNATGPKTASPTLQNTRTICCK